jgi:ATP-dependent helicase/DNAse subunit B
MRYVLKLEPVNERDEWEEDFTERGSRIHKLLEFLEKWHQLDGHAFSRLDLAQQLIEQEMKSEATIDSAATPGLFEIDRRRLVRALERYVRQHAAYEQLGSGTRPIPHQFEVVFGYAEDTPESHPSLRLGSGTETVLLQGKIDRLDLIDAAESGPARFRVIDYKTGLSPSKASVRESLYLQLPLYALAVERLVIKENASLYDAGYWGLAGSGFTALTFPEWGEDQERLVDYVTAVVNHLRHGIFPIAPRKEECDKRCDYAEVCRIGELRHRRKVQSDALQLELKVR